MIKYDFSNKRVLITGGSSGIGKATAMKFASYGAKVAILARTKEKLEKASIDIKEHSGGNTPLTLLADVSKHEQVLECFNTIIGTWNGLDIIVNGAGINNPKGVLATSVDEWKEVIDINLTGVFICCKFAAEIMCKQKKGNIINVSSIQSQCGGRSLQYSASKVGVEGITKSLAREMAKFNIRVNSIAPSGTETDFSIKYWCDAKRELLTKRSLIGRIANPDEIAEPILFLASDASSYITGSTLYVDGGVLIN
jgi:3-oxoacyl-[acyl-carrier protein] reductase